MWTEFLGGQVSNVDLRKELLVGHAEAVSALLDMNAVWRVEQAIEDGADVPVDELGEIICTTFGSTIYREEAATLRYKLYLNSIKKALRTLEDHHFDEVEMSSFQAISMQEGKAAIDGTGFKAGKASIEFLTGCVKVELSTVNDEWSYRLHARMRSLAVSRKQVSRLPWETLMYEDKQIPGYPETIEISPERLQAMQNVRSAAIRIMGSWEPEEFTFADMRKMIGPHRETLCGMDRFWIIDHAWLMDHAEHAAERQVRADVSGCLQPRDDGPWPTLEDAYQELVEIRGRRVVAAIHDELAKNLRNLCAILEGIKAGAGPTAAAVSKMAPWYRAMLTLCEGFAVAEIPAEHLAAPPKKVRGRDAIHYWWDLFKNLPDNEKDLRAVQKLRQFAWVLTPAQYNQIDETVSQGIAKFKRQVITSSLQIEDQAAGMKKCVAQGKASSSQPEEQSAVLAKTFMGIQPLSTPASSASSSKGSASSSSKASKAGDDIAFEKQALLSMFRK